MHCYKIQLTFLDNDSSKINKIRLFSTNNIVRNHIILLVKRIDIFKTLKYQQSNLWFDYLITQIQPIVQIPRKWLTNARLTPIILQTIIRPRNVFRSGTISSRNLRFPRQNVGPSCFFIATAIFLTNFARGRKTRVKTLPISNATFETHSPWTWIFMNTWIWTLQCLNERSPFGSDKVLYFHTNSMRFLVEANSRRFLWLT